MKVTKFQTEVGEVTGISLSCSDFDNEITVRYTNRCSPGCEEGMKLFFSPRLRSSSIHAEVCAGRYEFVSKMSREWWARKAGLVLGWDEDFIRENIDQDWAARMKAIKLKRPVNSRVVNHCIECGQPVRKGDTLCEKCLEFKPKEDVDYGSLDDL